MLCENKRKSLILQVWIWHINIENFRLFKMGGRVVKRVQRNCHPLRIAKLCMFLAQNSQHYVNKMAFNIFGPILNYTRLCINYPVERCKITVIPFGSMLLTL